MPHPSGQDIHDTPLSKHGEEQAEDFAAHIVKSDPSIDVVYTSPFYRCVQSIEPAARALEEKKSRAIEIRGEPGLGEWYGTNRSNDPQPAPARVLQAVCPRYSLTYESIYTLQPTGESIEQLYMRVAYVIATIIQTLDSDPTCPKTLLICTHAATFVILCRILTGSKPEHVSEYDFQPFTSCLSKFVCRRRVPINGLLAPKADGELPELHWANGAGIGGKWDCHVNGDCSFLRGGYERGWRFSGNESFNHALCAHKLDAGTGLGVIMDYKGSLV